MGVLSVREGRQTGGEREKAEKILDQLVAKTLMTVKKGNLFNAILSPVLILSRKQEMLVAYGSISLVEARCNLVMTNIGHRAKH